MTTMGAGVCGRNLWLRNTDTADAAYGLLPALFPKAAEFPLNSEFYTDCRPAHVPLIGDFATKARAQWEAANRHVEGDTP